MYLKNKKQFYTATKEIGWDFYERFQLLSYYFNIWKSHFLWLCIGLLVTSVIITSFIPFTYDTTKGMTIAMLVIIGAISIIAIHCNTGNIKEGTIFYAYQIRKKIAQKIIDNTPINIAGRLQIIEYYKGEIRELETITLLSQIEHYYKYHGIDTLGYTGNDLVDMWKKYKRPELIVNIQRKINSEEVLIADYEKQKNFCENILTS